MIQSHFRCVYVPKILRSAVVFLAFFTSSSFSQVTANIADQYFEDISNPLTLDVGFIFVVKRLASLYGF